MGARRDLTQHVTNWHWRAMPLREFPAMPQGLAGCPMDPSSQLAPAGTPPSAANHLARLLFCVPSIPTAHFQTLLGERPMENRRCIWWDFRYMPEPIAAVIDSPNNETTFVPCDNGNAADSSQYRRQMSPAPPLPLSLHDLRCHHLYIYSSTSR